MPVFVNRVLNLKKIKVIGFDMDYTIVRYHSDEFESLTHEIACKKLVNEWQYPSEILKLKFDPLRSIGGLVIDKRRGNLLKLSRYGKVKISYHGTQAISYKEQAKIYREMAIDLSDPAFKSLDTAFALSYGVLYSQLVQLKSEGLKIPDYETLTEDVNHAIDRSHQDGSIKSIVIKNFDKYVIDDPLISRLLERYRAYHKKLVLITNSDYNYTKALLDYSLNPHFQKHKKWEDVFDVVITSSEKPSFFQRRSRFLKIEDEKGTMSNWDGKVDSGIFQGGWFQQLQDDLNVNGSEILYFGDHIYGDVVSIKKTCNWRTALVLEDLKGELEGLKRSAEIQKKIDNLMKSKRKLESKVNLIDIQKYEGKATDKKKMDKLYDEIDNLNHQISELLSKHKEYYNPYWGEILRAGSEESRFAEQVETYACLYMAKVSDLYNYSPRNYFRPHRRIMAHEIGHYEV